MRFDAAGALVARRPVRIAHAVRFAVNRRERIRHESGYWFTATSGPFAGWLLREQAGRVYWLGCCRSWATCRRARVTLPGGHIYVGHTYDARGAVTGTAKRSRATRRRRPRPTGARP